MYKRFLIFFLVLFAANTYAQRRTPWNIKQWDKRKYHFGFTLGYNSSGLNLKLNDNALNADSLIGVIPEFNPGFNLGIVTSLTLHPNLRLRFIPSLSFQDRSVLYNYNSINPLNQQVIKKIESTFVSFPLLLKYRSKRINNVATYVISGFKYSMDMASQKDVNNDKSDEIFLKMAKNNYSLEIGGGFDFFLLYFKFGLELKAEFGIPNVLIQDGSRFASPIDEMKTRGVFFSLTFEG